MDRDIDEHRPRDRETLDDFLATANAEAAQGEPVSIRIRDLIAYVDAKRRGTRVTDEIERALVRNGLTTKPSFATGWVDNVVQLQLASPAASSAPEPDTVGPAAGDAESDEAALTVSSLESASAGVVTVDKTQNLLRARALMLRYDFSQLAVMSGPRRLVGAVSWQSMAIAALCSPQFTLADATVAATQVEPEHDLISLIPRIAEEGFVFVVAPDRTLAGIVTTADLSQQFATLAKPFLLIGEIERSLRRVLSTCFSSSELAAAVDPGDSDRTVESPNDLTLGEILRFISSEPNWLRLQWPVERAEFVKGFEEVRVIRNDVMHFSPDPLSSEQDAAITNFLGWLRVMARVRVSP